MASVEFESLRKDLKLRAINCELNPLSRNDGSAIFSQGETTILASVLGPIEVNPQDLLVERAHIECVYRCKAGQPNIEHKLQESVIQATCEAALETTAHPRTMISIHLQELEDHGGIEACSINAACLALLISGLPMNFSVAAIHCIIDENGKMVIDPDESQAANSMASFMFVFDSVDQSIVSCKSSGRFEIAQFNDAELACRTASDIVFKFYRDIILKSQNKNILPPSLTEVEVTRMDETK